MKRKRKGQRGPRIERVVTDATVKLVADPKGSQVRLLVDGVHLTRHEKDGFVILSRSQVLLPVLDDDNNPVLGTNGEPKQQEVERHEVWKVKRWWEVQR